MSSVRSGVDDGERWSSTTGGISVEKSCVINLSHSSNRIRTTPCWFLDYPQKGCSFLRFI